LSITVGSVLMGVEEERSRSIRRGCGWAADLILPWPPSLNLQIVEKEQNGKERHCHDGNNNKNDAAESTGLKLIWDFMISLRLPLCVLELGRQPPKPLAVNLLGANVGVGPGKELLGDIPRNYNAVESFLPPPPGVVPSGAIIGHTLHKMDEGRTAFSF
jgi:hypothetical protein